MLKNYILLFVRNLRRQKLFSFINLMGLTVSMVSTILIYLYVSHELSYDKFHHHSERLYRVNQTFIWAENRDAQFSRTGPGVAHALNEELPEVEITTSLHTPGNYIMSYVTPEGKVISFEEDKVLAADTNFFKVLNFPLVLGDEATAFSQANSIVLTRSAAKKYFADANPVGKMVSLGGIGGTQQTFVVTGIMKDVPENSTIQFTVLLSMKNFPVDRMHWSWIWTQLETFVRLHENADIRKVREKLVAIPKLRVEETLRRVMNTTYDEYIQSGKKWELFLQPVTSMHLPDEPVMGSFPDTGNIKILYSVIASAIFIVLLSCINFMNLSAAQFSKRTKEASMRKIMGLGRYELVSGYFLEALIFCLTAMLCALALTQMSIPFFNLLTGKNISVNLLQNGELIILILLLTISMAAISSSYPAIILSKFNAIEALKGKFKSGHQGKSFRDSLVVFQFSISIILVICTAVVFQQLRFISEKDLGFDKENLIELEHVEAVKDGSTLAEAVATIPGIKLTSWCNSTPPKIYGGDTFSAEGTGDQNFSLNYASGDENYIPTLGLSLKYGRNFSKENPGDKNRVIVNEATLRRLGWPTDESALGKTITYADNDSARFEIIGILPDFNYWTLEVDIEPLAIFHIKNSIIFPGPKSFLAIRIEGQNADTWQSTLAALQQVWKQHAGDAPFEYGFVDQYFAEAFQTQQKFGQVLTVMAGLAILIACLGLLGMIVYALEQRTKEIGIRKINGASVWNILSMISKGYTKLIIIAFVISAPVAYSLMQAWLKDFAYRINPSPWIFICAGLVTLIIALLITSFHAYKAALTNPIDALRDE